MSHSILTNEVGHRRLNYLVNPATGTSLGLRIRSTVMYVVP